MAVSGNYTTLFSSTIRGITSLNWYLVKAWGSYVPKDWIPLPYLRGLYSCCRFFFYWYVTACLAFFRPTNVLSQVPPPPKPIRFPRIDWRSACLGHIFIPLHIQLWFRLGLFIQWQPLGSLADTASELPGLILVSQSLTYFCIWAEDQHQTEVQTIPKVHWTGSSFFLGNFPHLVQRHTEQKEFTDT